MHLIVFPSFSHLSHRLRFFGLEKAPTTQLLVTFFSSSIRVSRRLSRCNVVWTFFLSHATLSNWPFSPSLAVEIYKLILTEKYSVRSWEKFSRRWEDKLARGFNLGSCSGLTRSRLPVLFTHFLIQTKEIYTSTNVLG